MNNREFAAKTMNLINIIQDYKDKYGEDNINEYFKSFGTWYGIEAYLRKEIAEKKTQNENAKSSVG